MPLTPQDVSNKRFTPVRLREGYDMGEVDQFLDEVEAELERLAREADDLRAQLAGGSAAPATKTAGVPVETIRVETVTEASTAAARLLEIATRNADELVEGARAEAEQLRGDAAEEAERLTADAADAADALTTKTAEESAQVEEDARNRARRLDEETAERRTELMSDLESEREQLGVEVENLKAFEREYRSRLREYFHAQLERLDSEDGAADQAGALLDDEG